MQLFHKLDDWLCACACVCVRVCKREIERECDKGREKECVYVSEGESVRYWQGGKTEEDLILV
jgi:hypothetical protein